MRKARDARFAITSTASSGLPPRRQQPAARAANARTCPSPERPSLEIVERCDGKAHRAANHHDLQQLYSKAEPKKGRVRHLGLSDAATRSARPRLRCVDLVWSAAVLLPL